jgi:hypothetical protein
MTQALKLALEALNDMACWKEGREVDMSFDEPYAADTSRKAIIAIKEALAQPEQETVAEEWIVLSESVGKLKELGWNNKAIHKANTPPQLTWVGLTYEEQEEIVLSAHSIRDAINKTDWKLKEKNT